MELKDRLAKMRAAAGLSQEALAAELGVSRQAVQKWEKGACMPELEHLVKMAKRFHVTLDGLVLQSSSRHVEEMLKLSPISPDYEHMHFWESYPVNLEIEYRQCMEEGKDLERYRGLFQAAAAMPEGEYKERIADVLFDLQYHAGTAEGYAYDEPSDLEGIRAQADGWRRERPGTAVALDSRVRGAWLGRLCGCLLGKPVEGMRTPELHTLLKSAGNFPMHRYILSTDVTQALLDRFHFSPYTQFCADRVDCMPVDDDTNYTVLSSLLIERYGRDFTPGDVARLWVNCQSKDAYCTAERVAFKNFVAGFVPPQSAMYKNAYREWIGAQIRVDYYGYINPGNPQLAAEMAWRDASISHVKNGIYGAMYVAAMIAGAAANEEMDTIVRCGLSQIPRASRLMEAVEGVRQDFAAGAPFDAFVQKLHARFDEYESHDWCHAISNCMIVTAALLYGGGDFATSICMAVQCGFDTDCNGATVGSVLGMRNGEACVGDDWRRPLRGTLDTSIFGVGRVSIEELVRRTLEDVR